MSFPLPFCTNFTEIKISPQHDHDSMMLILMSVFALYAFGTMFGICEFGQLMSNGFNRIDDEIKTFNWYLFPHQIQQMLLTILMDTQRSVEFKCFGSISATREYSKKVSSDSTFLFI